jgi:thiamine biosynthesis lipoprotein
MGSHFEIAIPVSTPSAFALAEAALDRIDELEAQMSLYRNDSELSKINVTAHLGAVTVEPGLFALLQRAIQLGRATGGAYDVTSGALSLAWGFVKGPRRVPDDASLADALARTGQQHVSLQPATCSIGFDRPGIVLNLGGIGKGYAVDQATALVRRHWWPTPGLIHGGHSSMFALGSPPDRFGGRWPIALRNPFQPSRPLGTIWLRNRGLGTSGSAFQSFEFEGRTYSHILDTRLGRPAGDGPASVTVLAPTAADADALSTAFSLLGIERSADYCRRDPRIGAIFIQSPRSGGLDPEIVTLNIDQADFDPDLTVPVHSVTL